MCTTRTLNITAIKIFLTIILFSSAVIIQTSTAEARRCAHYLLPQGETEIVFEGAAGRCHKFAVPVGATVKLEILESYGASLQLLNDRTAPYINEYSNNPYIFIAEKGRVGFDTFVSKRADCSIYTARIVSSLPGTGLYAKNLKEIIPILINLGLLDKNKKPKNNQLTEEVKQGISKFLQEANLPENLPAKFYLNATRAAWSAAMKNAKTSLELPNAWQDKWRDEYHVTYIPELRNAKRGSSNAKYSQEKETPSVAVSRRPVDKELQTRVRAETGLLIDNVQERYFPRVHTSIVAVDPGSVGSRNGFEVGDRIELVDEILTPDAMRVLQIIDEASYNQPMQIQIGTRCSRTLRLLTKAKGQLQTKVNPFTDYPNLLALQAIYLGNVETVDADVLKRNLFSFIDALAKTSANRCIKTPYPLEETTTWTIDGEVRDPDIEVFTVPAAFKDFFVRNFDWYKHSRIRAYHHAISNFVKRYGCSSEGFLELSRNMAMIGGPKMLTEWEQTEMSRR